MKHAIAAFVIAVGSLFPASLAATFGGFDTAEKAITESENVLRIRVTRSVVIQEFEPGNPKSGVLRLITFRILSRYKQHPEALLGAVSDIGKASHLTNMLLVPGKDYVICFDGDGFTPTIRMPTGVFEIRDGKVFRPTVEGVFKESIKEFNDWMRPLIEDAEPGTLK